MTTNYRDPAQSVPSEEEATSSSSSSSSGEESQVVPRVLTSSSSQYFVQSVLGKGVYGKVVKCVKTATRETVAVKILKDNDVTAEVQNEMDVLEQLRAFDSDRFNFVRFNDCFIDREHICFEFEMLDMSLWDFLQKKPSCSLSVKEIRPVVHQMATALQLLKNMGIVHTDIKPDNIMMVDHVNQPMKIKLIDFGLACHVSESDWGISASPLAYRAPENILGFPVTPALDMWALGCVAAELFTGNLLYLGHSEYAMLRYMVQSQGQLPQRLLKDGINTKYFFRRKGRRRRRWRLKTSKEYGHTSWSKTCSASLDDLTKVKLVCHLSDEDTKAEIEDRENFVNLLKKMLHLDVDKRITPSHLLEDPFITMNDLADSHPNTFYVKSCCEMMEVCQDQSLRADNRDQASTSLTSVHQNLPAWLSHQEHPLILELASAFSCLAISTDQDPSEPQGKDEESTQPELLLPIRATDQQKRRRTPLHHSTQVAIEVPEPDVHAPFQSEVCQTTQNQELCQNSKEAPTEIPSSAVERKPQRKRTWDTFIASHLGLRKNPVSGSPMRKVMKMSILHNSIQAPTKAPSNEAEMKPRRKRTWDTFIASHLGLRKNPVSGSPMRKVMKMSILHTSIQAPTKAPSNEAEMKPRRKRTWDTFIASHLGLRKNPVSSSPMRKVMKMSILHTSIQAPTKAPSNEAEMKPRRKRTWDTFIASHLGLRKNPVNGSPMRKVMKMSILHTSIQAPTKAPSNEAEMKPRRKRTWDTFIASHLGLRKNPVSGSPMRKVMKMSVLHTSIQATTKAPSNEAEMKPRRKRTWDTFIASHLGLRKNPVSGSPMRKVMKMSVLHTSIQATTKAPSNEAEMKPRRKRTWDTFIASHLGLRKNPVSGPPMRKVMKMSILHNSIQAPTKAPSNEAEMKPRRKRTWDTFIASHPGLRKNPVSGSPMRKVMKMSILHTSIQAPTKAPSNEAEMKPRRKRTWDTFIASHLGLWKNPDSSPERKRMKMSLEICDSQQTSSSEVDPSESNRRSQDCSSRGRKRKRNEEG